MTNSLSSTELPQYDQAITQAEELVTALTDTQVLPLNECLGRVLATPIFADRDLPPFNRSALDGYAVKAATFTTDRPWPVAATVAAGSEPCAHVAADACVAIATGAPLPDGLDVVIPHERTDRGDHKGLPVTFSVSSVEAGQGVHRRGADANAGDLLLAANTILGPQHLGLAATVGSSQVEVRAQPTAVVITTGDEVVPTSSEPAPHQIRNSNGPQTSALLRQMGAQVLRHDHLADEFDAVHDGLASAISASDLVVTVGGVSAGDRDHVPDALGKLGMETIVKGCAMQPGRPILIGRCGATLVVGLPGNPVSALVCSTLFIWPLMRRLLGLEPQLPWRQVELAHDVRPNARRQAFRPAQCDGHLASVPSWAGSGDLVHTTATNGVVALTIQAEPLLAGTEVLFLPWPTMQ